VAAGRRLNTEGLGLEAAGVALEQGRIVADDKLRTTNRTSTSSATSPAATSSRTSPSITPASCCATRSSGLWWAKPSKVIPWCTFTDPELARVGISETDAKQRNVAHQVYRFPFEEIDRARAEGETEGFAKIITDVKGKLLGAAIVGPRAGELIAEYGLALTKGMHAKDVSGVIHTYPTLASISRRVADQRMKEGLTPTAKTWIKRIFRLQGA
jgi:pyruvate/2-oxoglutarate dehydrogenase complex dihydrolipoamide dehydrogenase (E3) component